jgi:hypothetical protein
MRKYRIKETVYAGIDRDPERRYSIQKRGLWFMWEYFSSYATLDQALATLRMIAASKVYYD